MRDLSRPSLLIGSSVIFARAGGGLHFQSTGVQPRGKLQKGHSTMQGSSTEEQAERAAVCRAVAEEFALPEADISNSVSLAADWLGEAE